MRCFALYWCCAYAASAKKLVCCYALQQLQLRKYEPRLITALSATPPRCQKAFLSFCVHHLYIALGHSSCSISCREALSLLVGSCAVSAASFPLSSFQSRALALLRVGLTVPAGDVANCSSKQPQYPALHTVSSAIFALLMATP